MIALAELNRLSAEAFVVAVGALFEHSPWVAERAAPLRPFKSAIDLHRAMCEAVMQAPVELEARVDTRAPRACGPCRAQG